VTDPALLAQDAIYAGLDALLSTIDLDLCAYLHLSSAAGPQLFLRRPDLTTLDASEAFTLFNSLRDALEHGGSEIPGFHALLLVSSGSSSRGLHAVGRRDAKLTDAERTIVEALCRATSGVAHALEPASEQRLEPARVGVEISGASVTATVEVARADGVATGRAEARSAQQAVAAAALEAFGGGISLAEVNEVAMAGDRAAVVLVEGRGARRIGSALCQPGGDPLFAFAVAALEAASRIPTGRR